MTGDKTVVSLIELGSRQLNFFLGGIFELRSQTLAHGIAHLNHATDAELRLNCQMRQRNQPVAFADGDLIIVNRVGVGFDVAGRGDGLFWRD